MIAYVRCLPAEPMVGCLSSSKWQPGCKDEDEEELIPLHAGRMGNAYPKLPGRLKRKLLRKEDDSFWPSKEVLGPFLLRIVVIVEGLNR